MCIRDRCKAIGYVEELAKPRPFELKAMMIDRAKAQGTSLPDGAAAALLERCGEDPFLLENEVDKLCALSGYQTVTAAMVADMGTVSLEADVFEMIRMITAKMCIRDRHRPPLPGGPGGDRYPVQRECIPRAARA